MLIPTVLSSLALSCFAIVYTEEGIASLMNDQETAVDLSEPVSTSTFRCIRQNNVSVVFIRGYSSAGDGQFDRNAVTNIQNAFAAGLGTEVFMIPQPKSSKTGAEQFDEMYDGLKNNNIDIRSVWIQVTLPVNWHSNSTINVNFLSSILSRTNHYGLPIGIYTNYKDWDQIVDTVLIPGALLWYRSVYSAGPALDFVPFGTWSSATVTQYEGDWPVCGVTVNRNTYPASGAANFARMTHAEIEVIGRIH
ncbi:hypothetical protein ANCDUO_14340 [Ancylostoma duodenale]|uniref:Glycosyl hydrolase family 25 n=1 Tax=Ancylostoma duodenale TaxID=51022 RepID=A0A0C2CGK5_9BILA|nr:hypothetical protein ANCDUO_14340 [Ancylostoma duodenale]